MSASLALHCTVASVSSSAIMAQLRISFRAWTSSLLGGASLYLASVHMVAVPIEVTINKARLSCKVQMWYQATYEAGLLRFDLPLSSVEHITCIAPVAQVDQSHLA